MAAGDHHSLALLETGECWAWGDNQYGQLGDGGTSKQSRPVKVQIVGKVVAVAAGAWHSLALLETGECWAWGYNQYGQLGNGGTRNQSQPIKVQIVGKVAAETEGLSCSISHLEDCNGLAVGSGESDQLEKHSSGCPSLLAGKVGIRSKGSSNVATCSTLKPASSSKFGTEDLDGSNEFHMVEPRVSGQESQVSDSAELFPTSFSEVGLTMQSPTEACHSKRLRLLRVKHGNDFYCAPVKDAFTKYEEIKSLVQYAMGQSVAAGEIKYLDEEGYLVILNQASAPLFLSLGENRGHKTVFAVEVHRRGGKACPKPEKITCKLLEQSSSDPQSAMGTDRSKCYLPNTAFRSPDGQLHLVNKMTLGSEVRLESGGTARVICLRLHEKKKHDLVELTTHQAKLKVSETHRIPVFSESHDSEVDVRAAKELHVGEYVKVNTKRRPLTKVELVKESTELFEVSFFPDGNVEAIPVPSWGIQTRGRAISFEEVSPQDLATWEITEAELCEAEPSTYAD